MRKDQAYELGKKHTPEPLFLGTAGNSTIVKFSGDDIALVATVPHEETAQRMVACYNALAGVGNPDAIRPLVELCMMQAESHHHCCARAYDEHMPCECGAAKLQNRLTALGLDPDTEPLYVGGRRYDMDMRPWRDYQGPDDQEPK